MSPERRLEAYLLRRAKELGWLARKLAWIQRRGAPDRFLARDGVVRLVELKSPTGVLSQHQTTEIAKLRAAGVDVRIIRTQTEADEALR